MNGVMSVRIMRAIEGGNESNGHGIVVNRTSGKVESGTPYAGIIGLLRVR